MNEYGISEKAMEIIILRPVVWECTLMAQIVCDQIENIQNSIQDESPKSFSIYSSESIRAYINWVKYKLFELEKNPYDLSNILAENIDCLINPSDKQIDPQKIIFVANRIAESYSNALSLLNEVRTHQWEISSTYIPEVIHNLNIFFNHRRDELVSECTVVVRFFEQYGPEILKRIQHGIAISKPNESLQLDLSQNVKIHIHTSEYANRALQTLIEIASSSEEKSPILDSSNRNSGYLYLLMNSSMPGLFKIGKTTRTTDQRIKELDSATGVPTPFVLIYEVFVVDCHQAEKFVHEKLDRYRNSEKREFFKLASSTAIDAMQEAKYLYTDSNILQSIQPVKDQPKLSQSTNVTTYISSISTQKIFISDADLN